MADATPPPADKVTPPPANWTDGMADDLKLVVTHKGFKDASMAIDAYRNLEKLHGAGPDRLLKLPERWTDDKGVETPEAAAVRERLGRPKTAKDYEFTVPKGAEKQAELLANLFHKVGMGKNEAHQLLKDMGEYQKLEADAATVQRKQAFEDQQAALKTEWGGAHDQNAKLANEAAIALGVSQDEIKALGATLGYDKALKLFHKVSKGVTEADFVGGRPPSDKLSPDMARAQIKALKDDKNFAKKLFVDGDLDARAKWDNLHKMASDGQVITL